MIKDNTSAQTKRAKLKEALNSGKTLQFPGAYNALVAKIIEQQGFDGIYISGAVIANSLGLPDIGLTSIGDMLQFSTPIAQVTSLPSIVDIDTGFGEPMNVARTVKELELAGLSGCHLEDQENPKRCGHLDNKSLVTVADMIKKVNAAAKAKNDPDFLIIARTDARESEGLDAAIERAKAYVDAGADMIFPEAMYSEADFEAFRKAIKVPLLANMTEFGKSKLLSVSELNQLGINMVIYPVTTQRLAMKAVEEGLQSIKANGTQEHILDQMQTRKRLYEVLKYDEYGLFDENIFNFKI